MTMIELRYRMSFTTPAFLGNAEQTGQWRTPPVKALLRQWWRVAFAADHQGRVSESAMRNAEGALFGTAADGAGTSNRSRLRLRLSHWNVGKLSNWSGLDSQRIVHPEVKSPVGAQLYLGYGPLTFSGGQTALKAAAAIQDRGHADLSLAFPDDMEAPRLQRALWLLHHYGTLGGRSRNGWGSFSLAPLDKTPPFAAGLDQALTLPWRDALKQDWPSALGRDAQGVLVWQTEPLPDWKMAMRRLAETKIAIRRLFLFTSGRDALKPEERHWLSYPVTNHSVKTWGSNARLPNALRFKVRSDADG
jgi:CRISPR-associated protein Cmr1